MKYTEEKVEHDKNTTVKTVKPKSKAVTLKTKDKKPKKLSKKIIIDSHPTVIKNSGTQPKSIGQLLKEERLKKGLTLNDVMKRLYIQREYLEAIENSTYDQLPEMAYTIGFVRAYSQLLTMDSDHLIKEFQKEYTPKKNSKEGILFGAQTVNQKPGINILWIAAGGLLVVFVLIYLFNSTSRHTPDAPLATPVAINVIPEVPVEGSSPAPKAIN